jgi:lysophospholipase L1-like esterase
MSINGVILFGDSVFFGYGASTRNLGCGRVLKNLYKKVPILIKARNNENTAEALLRLKQDVLQRSGYSCIFIMFGNNDSRLIGPTKAVCSLHKFEHNLISMIDMIKASRKIPVLCNLQPLDDDICYENLPDMKRYLPLDTTPDQWHKKYSDKILDIAAIQKTRHIDIDTKLRQFGRKTIFKDGLHPNDLGHHEIALLLADEIIRLERI